MAKWEVKMRTLEDVFSDGDKEVGFEKTNEMMKYILSNRPEIYASFDMYKHLVRYAMS